MGKEPVDMNLHRRTSTVMFKKKLIRKIDNYLFKSNPAITGATTICNILATIPFTSTGNLFPISNSDKIGVTKAAVAVDKDVITMLRGAICGSVRKVA